MANEIVVQMRSGAVHVIPVTAAANDKTPSECCNEFFDNIPFATMKTLQLEQYIFVVSQIETIWFRERGTL